MKEITALLEAIADETLKLGFDIRTALFPGVSPAEWEVRTRAVFFRLPDEVRALYSWRNGVWPEGQITEIRMMPSFLQLPLVQAVEASRSIHDITDPDDSSQMKQCFPIFTDSAGCYLAVQCAKAELDYGRIRRIGGDTAPRSAFYSLRCMLEGILECYSTGAFFLDDDGYLDQDYDLARSIFRRINHGLSPWD